MKIRHFIAMSLAVSTLLLHTHCGSSGSNEVWSEIPSGAIGHAISLTQGTGGAFRFPTSDTECPAYNDTDTNLSDCLDKVGESITTSAGQYLRRHWNLCQFRSKTDSGWWKTYLTLKLPNLTTCQNLKGSSTGFTEANLTAWNLVGESVTFSYGLGSNSDQTNLRFAPNGEVVFLYSDFQSGWSMPKKGGIVTSFPNTTKKLIAIEGVQSKIYQPVYGLERTPTEIYSDLQSKSVDEVLSLTRDITLSTQVVGDRLYETKDSASDSTAAAASPLEVVSESGVTTVRAGAVMYVQHNISQVVGITSVTRALSYTDANCCWPKSGQLTTEFSSFFNLPSNSGSTFTTEVIEFNDDGTCGSVSVTRSGADSGSGNTKSAVLKHCH